jgi:hypothetical protein
MTGGCCEGRRGCRMHRSKQAEDPGVGWWLEAPDTIVPGKGAGTRWSEKAYQKSSNLRLFPGALIRVRDQRLSRPACCSKASSSLSRTLECLQVEVTQVRVHGEEAKALHAGIGRPVPQRRQPTLLVSEPTATSSYCTKVLCSFAGSIGPWAVTSTCTTVGAAVHPFRTVVQSAPGLQRL